jgi:serine/threonine protein kinase
MWSSLEGQFIGGRYSIVQHIALGGMAAVFRGWDHRLERAVAIKVLRQLDTADERAVARFQREAYVAGLLDDPHVVRVYDFFEDAGCYYLVMEYVAGINLKQYLRRTGPLPAHEALALAAQVCAGLRVAHERGFVHRDIKPQNILLDRERVAKLTDFGIVYIAQGGALTSRGIVVGTADYIAPEQARGDLVTPVSDLYSAGVVLYELLTARLPFTGPTPVAVAAQHAHAPVVPPSRYVPWLSPYVDAIVLRAMQKSPASRYRSAAAMGLALHRALEMLGEDDLPPLPSFCQEMSEASNTPEIVLQEGKGKAAVYAATPPESNAPPRFLAVADCDEEDRQPDAPPSARMAWLHALVVCVVALLLVCGIIALEAWLRTHG